MKKETQFKELFEKYYAPLCLYAKRYIIDVNIRQDIVSEVFLKLWEKLEKEPLDVASILGYLQKSVRNQCLNYLKHQEYEWDYALWLQQKQSIDMASPDYLYTQTELYTRLSQTLKQMTKEQRNVFAASFLQKKTQEEMAQEMNVSVKTIQRCKQKVIQILKTHLKEYGEGMGFE